MAGMLDKLFPPLSAEAQARIDAAAAKGRAYDAWREQNTQRIDRAYTQWKQGNPTLKYALDMLPVTGQAMSAADANADYRAGNYGAATADLVGLVPGAKMVQGLGMVKAARRFAGPLWDAARWFDRGNDTVEYVDAVQKPGVRATRNRGQN